MLLMSLMIDYIIPNYVWNNRQNINNLSAVYQTDKDYNFSYLFNMYVCLLY